MKRVFKSVLMMLLVFTLFTATTAVAYADETSTPSYNEVVAIVDRANEDIQAKIDEAVAKADDLTSSYNMGLALIKDTPKYNKIAKELKAVYDKQLDEVAETLVKETNEIADKAIREAEEKGYTVQCQLVPVQLGDRVVMIDPLIVING